MVAFVKKRSSIQFLKRPDLLLISGQCTKVERGEGQEAEKRRPEISERGCSGAEKLGIIPYLLAGMAQAVGLSKFLVSLA